MYHILDGLDNRNLFSHTSGGQKSKIKVPENSVSGDMSFPGLQTAFSLFPFMNFILCVCARAEKSLMSFPVLIRTLVLPDKGFTLMLSFNLHYIKALSSYTVTLRVWAYEFEENTIQFITNGFTLLIKGGCIFY